MRVLVSGSSGLVGTALLPALRQAGYTVIKLVRRKDASATDEIVWDPGSGTIEQELLEGFDAVIHLAGENIAAGRWNATRKLRIWNSRVEGTKLLCGALAKCARPPKILLSASAIGLYGDRGEETCSEDSAPGSGFLPRLVKTWEAATAAASAAGIRVILPRLGIVLSKDGGALQKMLLPFKLGLGGKLGSGRQIMSWIEIDDLVRLLMALLADSQCTGAVNCVTPHPVSNAEFTKSLGRILKRPTACTVPAFVLRILFGQMADEALLASNKVVALRIPATFSFEFPELNSALEHTLHSHSAGQLS